MGSLQAHKRRIKSIDSTLNIARAMELVSSVKLKKLKDKYDASMKYLSSLEKVINEVFSLKEFNCNFDGDGLDINIVITSNLGLCGQYNEEVLKFVAKENNLKSYIVFGEKGNNFLKKKNCDVLFYYNEYGVFEDCLVIEEFSFKLYSLIKEGKIKTINVIYTKYINNLKYEVVKELLYPPLLNNIKCDTNYLIEPNNEEMKNELMSLLVKTKIESILLNSLLSESASRNNAMKNAKDNAEDLKDDLIVIYNKLRQQKITTELSDIVNGM